MYKYKKSKGKIKSIFLVFLIMILTSILAISLYKMYENINISTYETEANSNSNFSATRTAQYVDDVKKDSMQVADIVEKVNSSVVGISKIKDIGSTIFLKDGAENLGLRNRSNSYRKWIYSIK